jgi:hypothetical protein
MPTKIVERQWPLTAVADCTIRNIGAANGYEFVLPPNAMVVDLTVDTVVAFNSATTTTLTVADGATTFAAAVDVKTAGREAVTNIGKFYPSGGTIAVTLAETGAAATAGRAVVRIGYVILGRSNETQT